MIPAMIPAGLLPRLILPLLGAASQIAASIYLVVSARRAMRKREALQTNQWEEVYKVLKGFDEYIAARHSVDVMQLERIERIERIVFGRKHEDAPTAGWTN
jgi:hypothetical protein